MLVTIRKNVFRLKSQGKSLDEIVAAKPTAQFDAKWASLLLDRRSSPALYTKVCDRALCQKRHVYATRNGRVEPFQYSYSLAARGYPWRKALPD